tara:strand:- start:82 stop:1326 length:1245 start_codon:yes stop_codon:yes gene_type:complete
MSSLFKTIPGKTIKGFAGKEYPVPFYLQFVPGYVVDVVHSHESLRYTGEQSINTIIALPHVSNKPIKNKANANEDYRYYPLFRGMNDIPSKGDPVLLCTINKINYYLGPLNTLDNNPTWNNEPRPTKRQERIPAIIKGLSKVKRTIFSDDSSPNFNKQTIFKRLVKVRKEDLDYGKAVYETTGDYVIEGRHGNSIRVGSRSDNPYVFLSNGRAPLNQFESIGDGSLISITSNGTLQQHFGGYVDDNENTLFGFQLASDLVIGNETSPDRTMGSVVSNVNNDQDPTELIYDYSGNQMLFHSDRITINSKLDDIFLSSNKDIHIGTKRHLTITTNKNLVIDSNRTFLGNPFKTDMDNLVLGKKLQEVLNDIVDIFSKMQVMTQIGPQNILPITEPDIQSVKTKIESIISNKHFIEE